MSENNSSSEKKSQETSSDYGNIEEMPTVTTLLDRRKLQARAPAPVSEAGSLGGSAPKIKAAPRSTERRRAHRLELWTPEVLSQSTVPEFKAVETLFSQKADWCLLFLKREDAEGFDARAVSGASRERWAVWTGLSLSHESVPEVWKDLSRADALSLRATEPKYAALRSALGVLPEESAWIFWVGPRNAPLGILLTGGRQTTLGMEIIRKLVELLRS